MQTLVSVDGKMIEVDYDYTEAEKGDRHHPGSLSVATVNWARDLRGNDVLDENREAIEAQCRFDFEGYE